MANLTQLKMLEDLSGFLLVDKPAGLAFSSIVKTVKRKFGLVKVGHGGSLDAMASGLLILLIGDANKFVGDVVGAGRVHTGTILFGRATNTHDIYGETVSEKSAIPSDTEIASVLPDFQGDIFQTESRWCSVRKEGSAAYEIADTGEHKPFLSHVYHLAFEPGGASSERVFSVKATKGLIVRTLAHDVGAALGCGAVLKALRRTAVGKFDVTDAVTFEKLLETPLADFASLVLPLSKALA